MTISSRRQSRPLSSTSSSSSSDPSSSSSSTRPSLTLTVCTTLLTLTLLSPCSTPVFASPTPSPGLTPGSGSGLGLGASSAPGSGSGSGSGFLTPSWSTSSSSSTSTSTAGSTSVSPSSSPSLQTAFGPMIPVDEVEMGEEFKLVGLGYGSSLGLVSKSSSSSSNLIAGSDSHVDMDLGVVHPEPVISIPQEETEEDPEHNQSSTSTWLKALRSYFSLSARSARSQIPTLAVQNDLVRDSSRPDQARNLGFGSGKTGRRREGDEQDIAGLGKRRRGKFWARAEAGSDPGVPGGSGTVETIAAAEMNTSDTSANTATTGYLSTPLPTAPTTALPLANSFPLPLDSTLSYSLTNSCVAFLTEFLTSEEMAGSGGKGGGGGGGGGVCKPFGLLLGSSSGWADLIRQPDQLNPALSQICHPSSTADSDECSAFFGSMAKEMVKPGNCRQELQQGNTVALSVYRGFQFYDMMQQAACLQDQGTGAYCYLEAMSADRPDDAYLWSIPGGNTLPSTTKPTCSACSKSLLDLYATAPSIKTSSDISKSAYGPSFGDTVANVLLLVTDRCGAGFLDVKLASAATSGATGKLGVGLGSLALGVVVSLIATMAMSV